MNRKTRIAAVLLAAVAMGGVAMPSFAQAPAAVASADHPAVAKANASIEKGLQALKGMQKPDGGWQDEKEPPAISAIVLRAFVQQPGYSNKTDFVAKGYQKLLSYQLPDGGIYKDLLANYNTSISLSALAAAKDPAYQPQIDKAIAYLKGIQWTENAASAGPKGEKITDKAHPWYGGFGYSTKGRPDGSNTQMTLEALKDAGLNADDPAFKAALIFTSRLQNKSETNDQKFATDDGGFIYSAANNGESMAGEYTGPDGRRLLRSYGSMTYAGLKSMMYAGLTKDDPRVKSAWDWISKNWTLEENPGMRLNDPAAAKNGLFYYYHTLARALNAYNEPTIVDPKGTKHDWRLELIEKITSTQKTDGSWEGAKRWQEDKPVIATSYAVLALQEAIKDLKENPPAK